MYRKNFPVPVYRLPSVDEQRIRILKTNEPTPSYAHGGIIHADSHGIPPKMTTFRVPVDRIDNVPILAQEGELMIPKKFVPMVQQYLHSKNIILPK
jgi:hypothetical protein